MMTPPHFVRALPLLAALLALTSPARGAEPRVVSLEVVRAPGAERCPATAAIAAAVRLRLPHDPFAAGMSERITLRFSVDGSGFAARISLSGAPPFAGVRTLRSPDATCRDLADTVALTLAVAIDPLALYRPAPPPGPIGERRTGEAGFTAPTWPRRAPEAWQPPPTVPTPETRWRVGLGATVALEMSPGINVGPGASAGIERDGWGAELGVHGLLYGTRELAGGAIDADLIAVTIAGCRRLGPVGACLVVMAGSQLHGGDVTDADGQVTAFVAPGLRLEGWIPLAPRWSMRLDLSGWTPLTRVRVRVGGDTAWETPRAALSFGLGLFFEIE